MHDFPRNSISPGVVPGRTLTADRFIRCTAVLIASTHQSIEAPSKYFIDLDIIVRLARSATPFCCEMYGTVFWYTIPLVVQYCPSPCLRIPIRFSNAGLGPSIQLSSLQRLAILELH